ncbi:MAG: site-specific integrase [Chloroflexi bacterium]|nr:site-specific integrase [Chloroflexota bacterium]
MSTDPALNNAHITAQTLLPPVIRAWEIYLKDQRRSPYTVKAFIGDLQLLATFLPPDLPIGAITTNDLNHFLDWLQNNRGVPCSPKSLARRITSIKAFFRWLHNNAAILTDPAEKVVQQSVISPLPIVLTPEEEQKVLEIAEAYHQAKKPDTRPLCLLLLLLQTGIKKGECLAIAPNHIDLDSPSGPFLFVRYQNPSSRYKERKISLTPEWIEIYHEYLAQYNPNERLFPWSPRRLEYLLEDLGKEAGLDKHLSFDMCRWTSALNDWRSSMEHEKIRQKLGISKIQWREISLKLRKLAGEAPPAA